MSDRPVVLESDLERRLRTRAGELGFGAVGFASTEPLLRARRTIIDRKADGLHGGMNFTYRNPERSTEPNRILPGAKSMVVGAWPYPAGQPDAPTEQPHGRVAAYAQVDFYADLRNALKSLAEVLDEAGLKTSVIADDNGLVDRAAALRAGIGWQGKNTNLLVPGQGSWFVIGAVITDAELTESTEVADNCGTCTRCLEGCPTEAIVAPGVLDARRCLAWLVQAPGEIPHEFREAMGDRIYGCDECQEVCPPNRRLPAPSHKISADGPGAWVPLLDLLDDTDQGVISRAGQWYIPQRDPRFVRRNALVILGNTADPSDPRVVDTLARYLRGDDDLLAAHALWAARRLGLDDLTSQATPGPLVEVEAAR